MRAVVDFSSFEQLTALRLPVTLRLFQYLMAVGYMFSLLLALAVSLAAFSLVQELVRDRDGAVYALTVMFCVANLYSGGGYILREAFSRRRFAVSHSPNLHLFRALDLRATQVFAVYCGLRITLFYLLLLVIDVAFVTAFQRSSGLPMLAVTAVATPVSMWLVTLGVAAKAATRRTPPQPMARSTLAVLGVLVFGLGYGTARFVVAPYRESGLAASFSQWHAAAFTTALGVVAVLAGVVSAVRLIVHMRQLARESFAIEQLPEAPTRARPHRDLAVIRWPLLTILHRELAGSWVSPLVRKTLGSLAAAVLAAAGVLAAGGSVFPLGELPGRVTVVAYSLIFVTLVGAAELMLIAIGPTTLAAQFRAAWENQFSQWNLVGSAVAYYLAPVSLLAVAFGALHRIIVAGSFLGPVSIGIAVVGAMLVAESVTPTQRNADGSVAPNAVSGLVGLLLAAPVLLVLSTSVTAGEVLALAYGSCLLGGAVACMERRIRTLASTFAM